MIEMKQFNDESMTRLQMNKSNTSLPPTIIIIMVTQPTWSIIPAEVGDNNDLDADKI